MTTLAHVLTFYARVFKEAQVKEVQAESGNYPLLGALSCPSSASLSMNLTFRPYISEVAVAEVGTAAEVSPALPFSFDPWPFLSNVPFVLFLENMLTLNIILQAGLVQIISTPGTVVMEEEAEGRIILRGKQRHRGRTPWGMRGWLLRSSARVLLACSGRRTDNSNSRTVDGDPIGQHHGCKVSPVSLASHMKGLCFSICHYILITCITATVWYIASSSQIPVLVQNAS
jgi:hypothetical protein